VLGRKIKGPESESELGAIPDREVLEGVTLEQRLKGGRKVNLGKRF